MNTRCQALLRLPCFLPPHFPPCFITPPQMESLGKRLHYHHNTTAWVHYYASVGRAHRRHAVVVVFVCVCVTLFCQFLDKH